MATRATEMTSATWVTLGLGAFIGFFVGRTWAELGRARYDIARAWANRHRYRK